MAAASVFICRKCGQCCEGRGGIVLSQSDLSRLASFLDKPSQQVLTEYGEIANGKMRLKTAENGYCIFFDAHAGCSVHEGKPDICRAWPYFRGNLEDSASFQMARDYCPGISREASHAEFVREGKNYLSEGKLFARQGQNAANSLLPQDDEELGE